jgi:hypothetical protein
MTERMGHVVELLLAPLVDPSSRTYWPALLIAAVVAVIVFGPPWAHTCGATPPA